VKEKGDDYFADEMIKMCKKITEDINLDIERSRFLIGVRNIRAFVDNVNTDKNTSIENAIKEKIRNDNYFFKLLDLPAESNNSEINFRDDDIYSVGRIDLVLPSAIVDFKTGKNKKSPSEILRELNIKLIKDKIDFQPLMYILEMKYSDSNATEFIYEYPISNSKNVIKGDASIDDTVVCVKHYKMLFYEFLQTDECMNMIASSNDRRKFMEKIGYDIFINFFRENPLPIDLQFDDEKLLASDYRQIFMDHILIVSGNQYKIKEKDIDDILKNVVNIRTAYRQKVALIFDDDIEEFESFIRDKYNEICSFMNDSFPFRPLNKEICEGCYYKDICLKQY
jgi:hypothetical protein